MLWLRRMARCGMFIVYAFIILDISTHMARSHLSGCRLPGRNCFGTGSDVGYETLTQSTVSLHEHYYY